jgi:hypothetical protein
MYKLFSKRFEANNSVIRPPAFELLRRIYQREIFNIVNYYNNRVYAVKSNHILCRVINTTLASFNNDLDRYVEIINTRSPYVAKHFNFTSPIGYGTEHDGLFYGKGNTEIIVYDEEYFNPYAEIANWRQIKAIEVLYHEFSDLGLLLPDGSVNSTDKGLCVIKINIPLLLIQYRGFVQEQFAKMAENDSRLGITHFVHMYVLPNMLYSHIELCIMNRLMNLFYSAPMGDAIGKHAFPIVDYSGRLDNVLKDVLHHIENTGYLYYTYLKNIPSVFKQDMQDCLIMPDMAKTKQVWWALTISRLRIMKFLIDCGDSRGLASNRSLINRMKLDFKRILDENTIEMVLNKDLYFDLSETMLEMLDI